MGQKHRQTAVKQIVARWMSNSMKPSTPPARVPRRSSDPKNSICKGDEICYLWERPRPRKPPPRVAPSRRSSLAPLGLVSNIPLCRWSLREGRHR